VDPLILENTTSLGMVAHDLRHPAAALVTYSELLAQTVVRNTSEEQRWLVDSIHSVSKYLLRLLDDALDLAQAQSGTVQLRAVPSTVVTIVAQCVAISRPLADRKQIRLNFFQEGKPRLVLLDALKMSKVFNNLIENAIRCCQPGALIEVRVSRSEGAVLVSVHDDGPGIDPVDLRTLFIPFQKIGSRARSDESSTGLGLAIAKHAVDLHGGRIWANSEVGKGTTFYVSLPAATNPAKKS
jgi:signal transduction histidine kinase